MEHLAGDQLWHQVTEMSHPLTQEPLELSTCLDPLGDWMVMFEPQDR